MGRDELRRALNEASDGPERDFTGTWAEGRRVRRRRQTAQGLGVVALAAAAVGAFTLSGGSLLGEDATIEPLPPATQTLTTEQVTDEPTEVETTEEDPTEGESTEGKSTDGPPDGELPGPDDPLPTTVEEYARTFLTAGMAGDGELLARMGTDGAVEASVTWTQETWLLDEAATSDRGAGEVQVEFFADGPFVVILSLDREAVEAGADDAVLHGEAGDAVPPISAQEYADEVVRLMPTGSGYSTQEANEVLQLVPEATWERTGSTEQDGNLLVTYESAEVEGELTLTVDLELAEAREFQAVVAAEFSGEPVTPGDPPEGSLSNPCDEPWSQVPSAGAGEASEEVALTALDLLDLAAACNIDDIVARAEQDATVMSPVGSSPAEAFAGDEAWERVNALALLLSEFQPALETDDEGQTVAVWPGLPPDRLDELVELGLHTQEEVDTMQAAGKYSGWQVRIAEDGTWLGLTSGD